MSTINIGLLGCGRIAQSIHLDVLARLPGARVVALAESDPARREAAGRRVPQAKLFADYRELLSDTGVAAVTICLPPALHAEAAVAAFEAGKHVYLEKPIATAIGDAREALAAWRRSGLVGAIGFNFRFNPLYRAAKQRLRSGRLGTLVAARSVFSSTARSQPAWKRARISGGGALLDLASHHIDLTRFLFEQPIVEVSAALRSQRGDHDTAIIQMRLASDLLVQSSFSTNTVDEDRFEIYGQDGKLAVDRYAADLEVTAPEFAYGRLRQLYRELRTLAGSVRRLGRPPGEPSYTAALRAFVVSVQGGNHAGPTLQDGYHCIEVIDAAEKAAATGRTVCIDHNA